MIFTVINIEEDLDYGCEERPENMPIQAVVTLSDENGEKLIRKYPDASLVKENIQIEDRVIIDEQGNLKKVLSQDWTKNCTPQTVDIPRFVAMMEAVKAGRDIEWICPFCGGEVKRMTQKDGHTVIGCCSCDMRIDLKTQ